MDFTAFQAFFDTRQQQLLTTGRLYALVDGLLYADQAGVPQRSHASLALFDQTPGASLADAGPKLIRLLARRWRDARGTGLAGRWRRRWRRLDARLPDGQTALLRFYDARITTARFARYRAYLEGVEERTLHTHYGAPSIDVRVALRTLATLRDTLTIAARRAGDRDAVHLLQLKPGSLPADANAGGAGAAHARRLPRRDRRGPRLQ
ncbi:DUF4123 domain-containing protein [Burkholderia gladioli]|uniref:DUF4123 domain-containing protein n=1 Tax=Burkholderia gladioli TaxID=28095 RepID=UPI003F7A800D